MARKRFVSGDLTIDIKYNDRGFYTAKVCNRSDRVCETVKVPEPASLRFAVDSPRAFHDAAHAAISFSRLSDGAATNPRGRGWALRRPRRKARQ